MWYNARTDTLLTQQSRLVGVLRSDQRIHRQLVRVNGGAEYSAHSLEPYQSWPCCQRRVSVRPVTAGASFTRREAISTAGGVLLSGACLPALALDDSQKVISKGWTKLYIPISLKSGSRRCLIPVQLSIRERGFGCKFDCSGQGVHSQQWTSLHCLGATHSSYCVLSHICRCRSI